MRYFLIIFAALLMIILGIRILSTSDEKQICFHTSDSGGSTARIIEFIKSKIDNYTYSSHQKIFLKHNKYFNEPFVRKDTGVQSTHWFIKASVESDTYRVTFVLDPQIPSTFIFECSLSCNKLSEDCKVSSITGLENERH